MFATIAYIVAAVYGAQITPYALIATTIVDASVAKAFAGWMESRAMSKMDYQPVAIIAQDPRMAEEELEDMALDADEVEERYGN